MLRRIGDLLDGDPQFAPVLRWRERVALIQQALNDHLPPETARTLRVASQEGALLRLSSRSAAAATRVRQIVPRLIAALRAHGFPVTEIQIRVDADVRAVKPGPERHLSPKAREALAELQEKLPDGALKAAVARLRATAR